MVHTLSGVDSLDFFPPFWCLQHFYTTISTLTKHHPFAIEYSKLKFHLKQVLLSNTNGKFTSIWLLASLPRNLSTTSQKQSSCRYFSSSPTFTVISHVDQGSNPTYTLNWEPYKDTVIEGWLNPSTRPFIKTPPLPRREHKRA